MRCTSNCTASGIDPFLLNGDFSFSNRSYLTLWDKIINARDFLPSHCHVCFFKKHKACVVWLMHCNEHFGQEGENLPDRRILFCVLLIDGTVFFLQDTDLIFHSLWMQWSQKKQAISATWRPTTPCCLFPHTKIVKLFPFKGNKSWCSSWDRKTARTTSKWTVEMLQSFQIVFT